MSKNKRVVVARRNALQDRIDHLQPRSIDCKEIRLLALQPIKAGYDVIIAHGSSPQVGRIVLASSARR